MAKLCPSLLRLVDRLYTVIYKTQKTRTTILPSATVGELYFSWNHFISHLGRATCTVHWISSQEEFDCIRAKELLNKVLLSNLYTVEQGVLWLPSRPPAKWSYMSKTWKVEGAIKEVCDFIIQFWFFLSKVIFTDRCRWQNFHPSLLRLVNNFLESIYKMQKTRTKVLPFATVSE